jgi:signal transduction histidine kinase
MRSILRPTSLFFKVIVITSLILAFAVFFNIYLDTKIHEESIKRSTYEKARIIAEFIEKNVIRTMEKGKHFEIHRVLQNFATYPGIWKINVFTPDGTIIATTYEGELNKKVDHVDFFLESRSFIKEEISHDSGGRPKRERVYYYINPVVNKPECFQCHNLKDRVVGVLTVGNSLKEMDREISKVKRDSIVLAVTTIVLLSSVLGFLFLRFVNVPITNLIGAMKRVEQGDLDTRVHPGSRDEIGSLAKSLNTMIEKLDLAKREAEEYHQELVQRADRMASIGELASGIAHEIRNPLAGIQGAIQILAQGFPENDERKQISEEIQKQIHRLERLVKNLLNYTKPMPANYLAADINEIAEKVLSFFVTHGGKLEGLKIEKRFFSPLPKTRIDPNSMEQAFLNIILNAQKAMPQGGTLTVSTHLVDHEGGDGAKAVRIVFEDTGVGISKENLPKIFNPFFSTRVDGTGLGLSITKNIIEQHEGRIEVESQVNVGTKFTITLPVVRDYGLGVGESLIPHS